MADHNEELSSKESEEHLKEVIGDSILSEPIIEVGLQASVSSLGSFTSLNSLRGRYLRACLKPTFKVRRLKSKGAILVLVWNYLIFSAFYYLGGFGTHSQLLNMIPYARDNANAIIGVMTVFYPVAGWLADVYFGRYKVIRASLWMMWIGMLLSVIGILIQDVNDTAKLVIGYGVFPFLYVVIALGVAGFQANVIQFGIDQLLDASSGEISAFINWCVWTIFSSSFIIAVVLACIAHSYRFITALFVATFLTLALCSDFLLNKWLVVEPVNRNPLKLIVQVLRFACKNKNPRCRSAFTYWEDEIPSRINLAKRKYGGPFTNEEVEDVKTFLRILVAIGVGSVFAGTFIVAGELNIKLQRHFENYDPDDSLAICYYKIGVALTDVYFILIAIPLYELLLYPLFHKCIPNVSIFKKFGFGMVMGFLAIAGQFTIDTVGHSLSDNPVPCFISANDTAPVLGIDYHWMAIPQLLRGLAELILTISVFEFICAQSPYNMKGLLIGLTYGGLGVFGIVANLIILPLYVVNVEQTTPSCGFWYYLVCGVIALITFVVFCFVARWYKQRERDEVLNNQTFVERYYERYSNVT